MALLTEENLPTIVGILISTQGVYMAREVFKNFRLWRKGASAREREVMQFTVDQLEHCNDELDQTQNERDEYRRQVGRRDHVILSNGLPLPYDGTGRGGDPHGFDGRTRA